MGRVASLAVIMITREQTLLEKKDSIVDAAELKKR